MRRILIAFFVITLTAAAAYGDNSLQLLAQAWPAPPKAKVGEIGRGVGVVFSPDLSVDGNCRFYESLGFGCFEDADWGNVIDQIRTYDALNPDRRLTTLILETHGTNGNGLKLQRNHDPAADRSYIAVGALQEQLAPLGVAYIIISACNSGRLLRPAIYNTLDPNNGDKLFLPPTRSIFNASAKFDPQRSPVTVLTPQASHIESTLVASMSELSSSARRAINAAAAARHIDAPRQFAISDLMMEMLLRDRGLRLAPGNAVDALSREIEPVDASEALFDRFVKYVNATAATKRARKPAPAKTAAVKTAAVR